MNPGLTCEQLINFLDDYAAGAQPPDIRATFERHLAVCRHCRDYLDTYVRTIRLSKDALAAERLVEDMPEPLVRAILEARARSG